MAPRSGHKVEPIKCPLCDFDTKSLPKFEQHLKETHSTGGQDLYEKLHGPTLCRCGCGERTKWIDWRRGFNESIVGHNGRLAAYYGETRGHVIAEERAKKIRGNTSWCKGLTKETDERVAARARATSEGRSLAFDEGRITIWSKGLTKETDERVAAMAEKASASFKSGKRMRWTKGLSEITDPRLLAKNDALRERCASGELAPWHKGKMIVGDARIAKFWRDRDAAAEYAHIKLSPEQIESNLAKNTQVRLVKIDGYRNIYSPALWVRCVDCEWTDKVSYSFAHGDRCPQCSSRGSQFQREISAYIESLGLKVAKNVSGVIGGRQEIDVFVPEAMIGIECNGLYWHCEDAGRDREYHQGKTAHARNVGIRLMHVFEDEWRDKRSIVESVLRDALSPRKMTGEINVCTIDETRAKALLDGLHIDGYDGSMLNLLVTRDETPTCVLSIDMIDDLACVTRHHVGDVESLSVAVESLKTLNVNKINVIVDTRIESQAPWKSMGFTVSERLQPVPWATDMRHKFSIDSNEHEHKSLIWGCERLVMSLNCAEV